MANKILVIPDVHGRTFWKESIDNYFDEVDKVVFLGDYLDPYESEGRKTPDEVFKNMLQIMMLKHDHADKVILLKGNHDQHYSSERFRDLAGGSRMDEGNWDRYHEAFVEFRDLFKIAQKEEVNGVPYIFTHAGLTLYWIHKVNSQLWHLPDNKVSIADQDIIDRINLLDDDGAGQDLLAVIGSNRSWFGEKTGGVLWADVEEHSIPDAPKAYGLNKVFQVFGHTKLSSKYDMLEFENLAMIDSLQSFMIDASVDKKIMTVKDYEEI